MRALALLALLVLCPADLLAQGRSRRHRRPPRPPTGTVNLRVLRVVRASTDGARLAAPTVLPAVARCLDAARTDDPAGFPLFRSVDVVIGLAPGGRAQAVELDPPLIARGLSACLGSALLTWRQPGTTQPRASVYLRLEL